MVTHHAAPPGRRERKKTQVRKRILAVALELFARHGLDAVTVEHIADVADLGKGTIYNYFPAKEDIVVAFMADLGSPRPGRTGHAVDRLHGSSLERCSPGSCGINFS